MVSNGTQIYAMSPTNTIEINSNKLNVSNKIHPLIYGESEKVTILSTEYKNVTVTPEGQLDVGYRFSSGNNGFIYININGGSSQTFSFALSWGIASVSLNLGTTSTNSIYGIAVAVPNDGYYYKVKLNNLIKFERHQVDVYNFGEYKYTYYTDVSKVVGVDASTYRVYK